VIEAPFSVPVTATMRTSSGLDVSIRKSLLGHAFE
jgi:hypothetical protein